MGTYVKGNPIVETVTYKTPQGVAINPSTVAVTFECSDLVPVTWTYVSATTPAPGIVANTATGTFVVEWDTSTLPAGWLIGKFVSTGTGSATYEFMHWIEDSSPDLS